jgi:hypothetical protein
LNHKEEWAKGKDIDFREKKSVTLSEGSQASPVRPSDKGSVKVNALEAVA